MTSFCFFQTRSLALPLALPPFALSSFSFFYLFFTPSVPLCFKGKVFGVCTLLADPVSARLVPRRPSRPRHFSVGRQIIKSDIYGISSAVNSATSLKGTRKLALRCGEEVAGGDPSRVRAKLSGKMVSGSAKMSLYPRAS